MPRAADVSRAVESGEAHRGDLSRSADVVVVGSGAGGMVLATKLQESGLSVIVVEEGKHVPPQVHGRMRQSQSLRHLWRDGGMSVALGVYGAPTVNVTAGVGIGGSSLLTGGVCLRVPEANLGTWAEGVGMPELWAGGVGR
ncbi:MAG: FAD-binding protein [Sandaracinaceae bacterium]